MLNRWEGIGNLGKDPETRYTTGQNPMAVCRFSIAVDKGFGENKKTVWINIVAFGKKAESCQRYLTKGKKVYVAGELDVREYDKQDGTKGYITEVSANTVEFLSQREQDNWPPQNDYPPQQTFAQPQQQTFNAQPQYVTRDQYEQGRTEPPHGFMALTNEEVPF